MMAASARTSGTTLPVSSNLNRGSIASRSAAACWAALMRAALTRRRLTGGFFAVAAGVAFRTTGFFAVVTVFFDDVLPTAALDCVGSPTTVIIANKQISLAAAENRFRITGKPLCGKLLRNVSAL